MALVPGVQDGAESTDEKRRHRVFEEKTSDHRHVRASGHGGYETERTIQEERARGKVVHARIRRDATARSHRRRQLGAVERKLVRLRGRKDSVVARARVWVSDYF